MRRWLGLVLILAGCVSGTGEPPAGEEAVEEPDVVEWLRDPVLLPDVVVPERDHLNLENVEVLEDRLILSYSSAPDSLPAVGEVVVGALGGGYARRITAMRELGSNEFEFDTTIAQMTEVWEDLHFRMMFEPDNDPAISRDGEVGARRDGLVTVDFRPNFDVGAGIRCRTSSGSATATPVLEFTPTAEAEIDIRRSGFLGLGRPQVHYAKFLIAGELVVGVDVDASVAAGINCTWEAPLDDLAAEWTTRFIAPNGVPVVLTHSLGPVFEIRANVGAEISGKAEARANFMVSLGTEKPNVDAEWRDLSDASASGSLEFPEVEPGPAWSASVTAEGGLKYVVKAYDAVGPDISATIPVTASLEGDGMGCRTFDLTAAANASLGIEVAVPFLDIVVFSTSYDVNLVPETTLIGGPIMSGEGCEMDDPCADISDCRGCTRELGCGWCGDSCVSESRASECSSTLVTDQSACEPCDATDCTSCAANGFCVWCPGVGCVNDSVPDDFAMCGGDVYRNPGDCR
ncbi:MAG: hypothetical protein AAGE52_12830 [Myxococcota bacterium]